MDWRPPHRVLSGATEAGGRRRYELVSGLVCGSVGAPDDGADQPDPLAVGAAQPPLQTARHDPEDQAAVDGRGAGCATNGTQVDPHRPSPGSFVTDWQLAMGRCCREQNLDAPATPAYCPAYVG